MEKEVHMKKMTVGLFIILFSSLANASSKSATNSFIRSMIGLLRNNKTLLAAFSQRSNISGILGRRRRPANNGYTKCIIGHPYNTCEATPCNFCKDINVPPQNDHKAQKKAS
jgi:hypothetical protein